MNEQKMTLVEHLQDLRRTFIYSFLALLIGSVIGYLNIPFFFTYLKKPLFLESLVFLSPTEAFLVNLKLSLLVGLIIAFPVIFLSLAWFIAPGLTKKEKRLISILALVSLFLFILGAIVAYFSALPLVLKLLFQLTPDQIVPYISVKYYFSFVLNFIFLFGLSFQFPIIIFSLALAGIAGRTFWQRQRKYVILTLISLCFILAPGADFFSQLLLCFPLYLLFELTLLFLGLIPKRRLYSAEVQENAGK